MRVWVSVFARRLASTDQLLGRAVTPDFQGEYNVLLPLQQGQLDLYVQVTDSGRGRKVLATSEVVLDAGPDVQVDVTVGGEFVGPSSYEQLLSRITPVLKAEKMSLVGLTDVEDAGTALVTARSGADPTEIDRLQRSIDLGHQTKLPPEVFYGLGKAGVPVSLPAILSLDPAKRRAALDRAVSGNHAPAWTPKEVVRFAKALDALAAERVIVITKGRGGGNLDTLLYMAKVTKANRAALVQHWVSSGGDAGKFWAAVSKKTNIPAGQVTRVKHLLRLHALTHGHTALVQALAQHGSITLAQVAGLDAAGWRMLLKRKVGGRVVGVEPALAAVGVTPEAYAAGLAAAVEKAVPSLVAAAHLKTLPGLTKDAPFFEKNPGFVLGHMPVGTFVRDNPKAFAYAGGKAAQAAARQRVERLARVWRMAPGGSRISVSRVLLEARLYSAGAIRALGRGTFVARFQKALGPEVAQQTFTKALNLSSTALTILGRQGADFHRTPLAVLPPRPKTVDGLPEYEGLFADVAFCGCRHCRSVLSPAAYLVDVLQWLDGREAKPSGTALDVLLAAGRRPDIANIALTCENTNTPLPYVDLVNEVLELTVAPTPASPPYQTSGDPADLRAHPQHLRPEAYAVLAGTGGVGKDAVYPLGLPFDLPLETTRAYLGQLGIDRDALMTALHDGTPTDGRRDVAVARETLGLPALAWQIVTGQSLTPARSPGAFWNGGTGWVTELRNVGTLLKRARVLNDNAVPFETLTEWLRCDFVQGDAHVGVWFPGATCNLDEASIPKLSGGHLGRLHRFVRLQRRLGWSAADLDRAIAVLGGGKLDEPCLLRLTQVERLRRRLSGVGVPELVSWWGPLDTRRWADRWTAGRPPGIAAGSDGNGQVFDPSLREGGLERDPSPFERCFRPASVGEDPSSPFKLKPSGAALAVESGLLADYLPPVAAALGITGDDLGHLIPAVFSASTSPKLTLANLSALARHVSLAHAAGLTVAEVVSVLALTGIDPFDAANPDQALAFLDEIDALREAGVSAATVDYLLRDQDPGPAHLAPDPDAVGVALLGLGQALRKVAVDHGLPDPADGEAKLRDRLSAQIAALVPGADATDVAATVKLVDLAKDASPPAGSAALVDRVLGQVLDAGELKDRLVRTSNSHYLKAPAARLGWVVGALAGKLRDRASRSTVVDRLASAFGLSPDVAAPLLERWVGRTGTATGPAIDAFLEPAVVAAGGDSGTPVPPTAADLPEAFDTWKRLQKVALILTTFGLGADTLHWVFVTGPAQGTLDPSTLPVSPPSSTVDYGAWSALVAAVRLRRHFSGRLFDLFEAAAAAEATGDAAKIAAAKTACFATLAERSGWDPADLDFLATQLGGTYPADFKDAGALGRVTRAMAVVRRVGLAAETVWPWRTVAGAFGDRWSRAQDVMQAVRARFQGGHWLEVARPLRDRLRVAQRDALVGWLVGNDPTFHSPKDLYDHLLLDVEMSPCQLTSRIKQAISSTQLFVQKAHLGLEPKVALTEDDSRAWRWMQHYRVWEANRKVFLYPENWLDPAVRDDKTPFFQELEHDLAKADVTKDTAEQATRTYLRKLEEVARLEVMTVEHEDDGDVLHVVARTRGTPHRYYYRRRVGSRWTPWEKVDLDIDGDQLLLVVYQRRLHLFWAQITVAAKEKAASTPDAWGESTGSSPERYYRLRLYWSTYRDGAFGTKTQSKVQVGATDDDFERLSCGLSASQSTSPDDFFLHGWEDDSGDLLVEPVRQVHGKQGFQVTTTYARVDRFRMSGCDGTVTLDQASSHDTLTVQRPGDTGVRAQSFASASAPRGLSLPARNSWTSAYEMEDTLARTPTPFDVVPTRMIGFESRTPIVFQDRQRTFVVDPLPVPPWWTMPIWTNLEAVPLETGPVQASLWPGLLTARTNPWAIDASSRVVPADSLTVKAGPAVITDGKTRLSGLLAQAASGVSETLGERMAFVGDAPAKARKNRVALDATAEITFSSGQSLKLRSGDTAGTRTGLYRVTVNSRRSLPAYIETWPGIATSLVSWKLARYRFEPFYHPYVCVMLRQLGELGLDGLLDPPATGGEPGLRRQSRTATFFDADYRPEVVAQPYPKDDFDFTDGHPYAIYNWEVFFHLPLTVACALTRNKRFEDAQRYFHYIFDPTLAGAEDAPARFWKAKPLHDLFAAAGTGAGPIAELLLLLDYHGTDPAKLKARDDLLAQIAASTETPFDPFAIARLRLVAFAKAVVMRYVDNLIDWGDQLFQQDTMESINEATQLYVLAARILGPRPSEVNMPEPTSKTFAELKAAGLDAFGNAAVTRIEDYLPEVPDSTPAGSPPPGSDTGLGPSLFFCVPGNDKLLTDYWDRVADRLFKIRHCMNIEGKVQQLPLFAPPIDPGLLVRAEAAGVDLGSMLSDRSAPTPRHRFDGLAQRAASLTSDVRSLGQALLSALETKDAEHLARLRAEHQVALQTAMLDVRKRDVEEATHARDALHRSHDGAIARRDWYRHQPFMNPAEQVHFDLSIAAGVVDIAAGILGMAAGPAQLIPNINVGVSGFGGSPTVTASFGGGNAGGALQSISQAMRIASGAIDRAGSLASIMGGYQRRQDDWNLQGGQADFQAQSLDAQILAAEARLAVANLNLANLQLQIDQAKEIADFLEHKYTGEQLQGWLVDQLSALYFQGYQLAYAMAKRAEKAWQFELARPGQGFIHFGYWDGLKKGLLAGERLQLDLQRMQSAYLDHDQREYELTRHVSFRELDPMALVRLRREGECYLDIPEAWFDLDGAGHYLRRIKSVALSLPCVTGPYVPVRCNLTLMESSVRVSPDPGTKYERQSGDDRFWDDPVGIQSIVTSGGQNDSGLFETSLHDARYLPFEGAGAISSWHLELPSGYRAFDYDTISDIILHVRYTAREGGAALREASEGELKTTLQALVLKSMSGHPPAHQKGLLLIRSASRDEPDAWQALLHPPADQTDQAFTLQLDERRLPFRVHGHQVRILGVEALLVPDDVTAYAAGPAVKLRVKPPTGAAKKVTLAGTAAVLGGLPVADLNYDGSPAPLGDWTITFKEADNGTAGGVIEDIGGHKRLDPAKVRDLLMVVRYQVGA